MSDVEKWGDAQQYRAEPHGSYAGPKSGVVPQVTLLWMTPDPLGAVAAMAAMYEGRVVRDLSDLSHAERLYYWNQVRATHLDTPLEAITFQFLIEGVDRAFTHQLVRKRVGTAFAQESLRFAVPGSLSEATSLPPSLQGTDHFENIQDQGPIALGPVEQRWRNTWDDALTRLDEAYHLLVGSGMPAEEARGLLPHATATRVVYLVNLRSLLQEAGNRLCTQAQWHWKMVMVQMVNRIRDYWRREYEDREAYYGGEAGRVHLEEQFRVLTEAFKPICYELGRCPFKASFDRECTIRERVTYFAKRGVPSSEWEEEYTEPTRMDDPLPWAKRRHIGHYPPEEVTTGVDCIPPIRPEEWLLNPGAARRVD